MNPGPRTRPWLVPTVVEGSRSIMGHPFVIPTEATHPGVRPQSSQQLFVKLGYGNLSYLEVEESHCTVRCRPRCVIPAEAEGSNGTPIQARDENATSSYSRSCS